MPFDGAGADVDDITVNAVAPGLEGAAGAAAIADVVAFLVGSNARSLSGQVIQVDRGTG